MKKRYTSHHYGKQSAMLQWLLLLFIGLMVGTSAYAERRQTQSTGLVSNISASSGKSYILADLAVGVRHYTDRTYQVTSVPASLSGASLIRTANDDKRSTSSSLLTFTLNQQATVYVAYDPRETALPSWLSGWQKRTERVGVNDSQISYMELYSKSFAAGTVSLGGNMLSPAAGSENNYFVVAMGDQAPAAGLISNISVSSGRSYALADLAVGVKTYTDRTYQVTSVPASLSGASLIQTANDDKRSTSSSLLTFTLNQQATVYVAYDPRQTALPAWLSSGWQKLTERVGFSDSQISNMELYSKSFAAGTVTLGGNMQSPAAGSQTNYFVMAVAGQVPQPSGLVSNVSASSGRSYALADLAVGVKTYTDRTYQVTSVPASLSGASLIQTANDDKRSTSSSLLTFTLNQQATVYVAYDPRQTALPAWLSSGWQKLTERVGFSDSQISNMELYSKSFAAGTVTLGGNMQSPAAGSQTNYFVMAKVATTTGEDNIAPTVAVQLSGALQSPGVYGNEVTVSIQASDAGGSGLASVQYSLNSGAYTTYSSPFKISTVGNYTVRGRATDGSGNQTTTDLKSFSVVKAAQSNAVLFVENADKFPTNDHLVFSLIQVPWRRLLDDGTYTAYNENHNKVRLRLHNKGAGSLVINNLTISNTTLWKILQLNGVDYNAGADLPISISSKGYVDLLVEFIGKDLATRVKVVEGTLTIASNDDLVPNKEVKLSGLWQRKGEGSNEPYAQEIINTFGFKTRTGFGHTDGASDGTYVIPNSEEIYAPYFVRVDPSRPVQVIQMAAYHGCCNASEVIQWYAKGSSTYTNVVRHNSLDGQSLLPRKYGSTTTLAQGSFNPTSAFGLKVQKSFSDRTKNFEQGLGLRVWKALDANGNIIPNAYIVGMDYLTSTGVNYDYQDNIYYVTNLKPETGPVYTSELGAAPSAVEFGSVMTGSSKSLSVNLKNLGKSYDSGSDPSIQISSVAVVGPNSSEFSSSMPATTNLAVQASTNVNVTFRPSSLGIKNAALLVYYNNAASPLRIPLYGIANNSSATVSAVKRIKGASDASRTIAGNVWEADINYRKGSVKLDQQVVAGPIASTDDDALYQTYLSAATDLAETRYEIPVSNGSYMVRMHFVENFFNALGSRIFNVTVENELRLNGFDIYGEVGYRAALVKDLNVSVSDGVLTIKFNPTANRVAIAGLEIYKATSAGAVAAVSNVENAAIQAESGALRLRVYPNPVAGGQVYAEIAGFNSEEAVSVTVHDVLGRVVSTVGVITDQQGQARTEVAAGKHLNKGMYIVRAKAASGKTHTKLLVQ